VENALAFDAEDLLTVNTSILLANLTKSVVIEGLEFTNALEHGLKESSTLRKHSGVIHLASNRATRYVWTHKVYQPWGETPPVQCPQCGWLNPWVMASQGNRNYGMECRNPNCGAGSGRHPFRFDTGCPEGGVLLSNPGGDGSWMKIPMN
jgi:hypothetical protein